MGGTTKKEFHKTRTLGISSFAGVEAARDLYRWSNLRTKEVDCASSLDASLNQSPRCNGDMKGDASVLVFTGTQHTAARETFLELR